jgi:nicotinic acid mononucleotide adenylyltransferase
MGRFSPLHLGHTAVIDTMLDKYGEDNSLLLIGSVNNNQTLRHFFSFSERRSMIKMVYPNIRVAGVPDFADDGDWFMEIADLIHLIGNHSFECEFFAGCDEDVAAMRAYTSNITVVNRFDGTTPLISATQVRDALMYKREVKDLLHHNCLDYVVNLFDKKWEEYTRR